MFIPDQTSVLLERDISSILGFEKVDWQMQSTVASHHVDVQGGFHSMYVYCNAVEPQIVGDVYAPLLRTVGVSGENGETVVHNFINPHYLSVNADELNTLEINIKDDTGENVSFLSGKTICKLHFRKK